jgi:excisionase family DNA binding protein
MEQLMTAEEIAELVHVDPVTIRRLVNTGELSAYSIGDDYRFARSDLADYLQRQHVSARARAKLDTDPFMPLPFEVIQHPTPSALVSQFDYRFTKLARHVLTQAEEEARRFQHNELGTEHLLLGLVCGQEGVGVHMLSDLSIEEHQVRRALEALITRGGQSVANEVRLSPRAKMVLILAVDEASRRKRRFIGTQHLLLGIIRERDGMGGAVLETLGLVGQVRTETIIALRESPQEEAVV